MKNKLAFAKSAFKTENNTRYKLFKIYADKWLAEMKPQIKHSSYVKYNNIVNNHIIETLGDSKMSDITTDIMRDFIKKNYKRVTKKLGQAYQLKQ